MHLPRRLEWLNSGEHREIRRENSPDEADGGQSSRRRSCHNGLGNPGKYDSDERFTFESLGRRLGCL